LIVGQANMILRTELEAELARATAEREKARGPLSVLNKAGTDRRKIPPNGAAAWRKAHAERRKTETDRRKAGAALAKAINDQHAAQAYRRKADADLAAREKAFADWFNANVAVEKALVVLTKLKGANGKP
jgi:hypothetical protein